MKTYNSKQVVYFVGKKKKVIKALSPVLKRVRERDWGASGVL